MVLQNISQSVYSKVNSSHKSLFIEADVKISILQQQWRNDYWQLGIILAQSAK